MSGKVPILRKPANTVIAHIMTPPAGSHGIRSTAQPSGPQGPDPSTGSAGIDSTYAILRLLTTLALVIIGNGAIYVLAVMLPDVQKAIGHSAADASLPQTWLMIGFASGGVLCGPLADRHGVARVLALGAFGALAGFLIAGLAPNMLVFALAHGLLLGLLVTGSTFAPLIADTTLWWNKYRGLAVGICMCGNLIAGAIWTPIIQLGVAEFGWRPVYVALGPVCGIGMLLLARTLRPAPGMPVTIPAAGDRSYRGAELSPGSAAKAIQWLLFAAIVSGCAAMAFPMQQVIAYGIALGVDARAAVAMLALVLGFKTVGRVIFGGISDHIGGLATLLLLSVLQAIGLALFLLLDSIASLYAISAVLGLFIGGIVPAYVIIVRAHFPPRHIGARTGLMMLGVQLGLAMGSWLYGTVLDLTRSHLTAVVSSVCWALLHLALVAVVRIKSTGISAVRAASR
jgi:MFS family permease